MKENFNCSALAAVDVMPEFVFIASLAGLFYLSATGGLVYYYLRTRKGYLLAGGFAMAFSWAGAHAMLLGWYTLSSMLLTGYLLLLYAAVCNLNGSKASVQLISAFAAVTLVAWSLGLTGFVDGASTLVMELPALVLGAGSIFLLVQGMRSAGRILLAVMIALHMASRIFMGLIEPGSIFSALQIVDIVAMLISGGLLPVILAEQLLEGLDQRMKQLEAFEEENRRLELQFSQAQKHESLGVMAGGIAHDFNNMLTSVLGYTTLAMKKLPADSEARKDLYMAMSGARQAVELTSQMLTYAGKAAAEFETLDVSRVVDNMSSLINSVVPANIRLVRTIASDLPLMKGDGVQLGQVVMNLVTNAVEAMEGQTGSIEIKTGLGQVNDKMLKDSLLATEQDPGVFVYIQVSDSGVGIDPDQLERIFDPFFSDKNQKRGLGLSSISGIVRQHKGVLLVDSAPGNGSVFTAYFPVLAYQDGERISAGAGNRAVADTKGRVLLADDDNRIRSLIESILESDNYTVASVQDGREALQMIDSSDDSFDVFVLDCTMPKVTGMDVYRQLRSSGISTPVILISGYHQEQVVADISNDWDAYFVKKPFSVDELLETVSTARARQQSARHQGEQNA